MLPDLGTGLAVVGMLEAASNLAADSLIDRLGDLLVANTPLPVVEDTIKRLGVTDKPFLRANLALGLATAIGFSIPGRRAPGTQVLLAAAGAAAAAAGRLRLDRLEEDLREPLVLPAVAEPLAPVEDGAEAWPGAEPLFTAPERFYRTDVNMRPPAISARGWALEVEIAGGGSSRLKIDDLMRMDLRERDGALICVHNRPGWDRLGQQRWTGVPVVDVLAAAGPLPDDPERYDLTTCAADGYSQIIPLDLALEAATWVVLGMAGRPLPRAHGYPARVMTPGLVGQYNGVKWLSALRVVRRGDATSWWGRRRSWLGERSWPRGPVAVPPMARIDHPGHTGMPPRLPPPPVRVSAGPLAVVGTAWAPPHGVAAVEVRVGGGTWMECELAREINGSSWRRWRADLDLPAGEHSVQARCHSVDGTVQAGAPAEPFPHGSGAYHRVSIIASSAPRRSP